MISKSWPFSALSVYRFEAASGMEAKNRITIQIISCKIYNYLLIHIQMLSFVIMLRPFSKNGNTPIIIPIITESTPP